MDSSIQHDEIFKPLRTIDFTDGSKNHKIRQETTTKRKFVDFNSISNVLQACMV